MFQIFCLINSVQQSNGENQFELRKHSKIFFKVTNTFKHFGQFNSLLSTTDYKY